MRQSLKGTVIVLRDMNSDRVTIELKDESSSCRAVEITLSATVFADALFHRYVPCEYEVNDSGVLGARLETKTEIVSFEPRYSSRKATDVDGRNDDVNAALALFEVDGWRARVGDMWNGNRRVRERICAQSVTFFRYVRDGVPVEVREP